MGILIIIGDHSYYRRVISKLDDCVSVVHGYAVVGEREYRRGLSTQPRWAPVLMVSMADVLDPVAEGGVQSQGPELSDELRGVYGVEC